MGIILGDVGCAVADEGTGVQPVVRPYSHRHQAEGSECPHGGEEDLDPLLTHHAFREKRWEEDRGREKRNRMDIRSTNGRASKQIIVEFKNKKDMMCLQSQFIEGDSEHSGEKMRGARRWGAEGRWEKTRASWCGRCVSGCVMCPWRRVGWVCWLCLTRKELMWNTTDHTPLPNLSALHIHDPDTVLHLGISRPGDEYTNTCTRTNTPHTSNSGP